MRILTEDQVDISGFASIRERVLIQDRRYFSHAVPDECWGAFGPLVYLANAWILPRGSTGLHHHSQVDIVSVLPRGQITHEGTIGDGVTLTAGQAQVQRSGEQGFSHNEINPTTQVQPFVQLWLTPTAQEEASYNIIHLAPDAITPVEQRPGFELGVGQWQSANQWQSQVPSLLYIISGKGEVSNGNASHPVRRGTLISAEEGLTFNANAGAQFLYAGLLPT